MEKHPACIATQHGWVEVDHKRGIAMNQLTHKLHLFILTSPFYKEKENIYWPAVEKVNECDKKESIIAIFKTDYVNHILRYPEFTPRQFYESLLFLLEVCKYCKDNGYYLRSHLWNVTYKNGKPILLDIRDFEVLNNQNWVDVFRGHFRSELDKHCPVSANKFIENASEIAKELNSCGNSLKQIEEIFSRIKVKKINTGKWTDYHHARTDFIDGYDSLNDELYSKIKNYVGGSNIPAKSINLISEVERLSPITIIEMGCNNGLYCFASSRHCKSVVGVDYDIVSINKANNFNSRLGTNCTFVCLDLLDDKVLQKSYGKDGGYGNVVSRFRSELLIAPAIMHHLYKACENMKKIISMLDMFAEKYMIIEHINGVYDEKEMVDILKKYRWKIIKGMASSPSPRKYYVCEKE